MKSNLSGDIRHRFKAAVIQLLRLRVYDFKKPFRCCHRTRSPVNKRTHIPQRLVEHSKKTVKSHQGTERHRPGEDIQSADIPDDERPQLDGEHQRRVVGCPDHLSVGLIVSGIDISVSKPTYLTPLLSKGADNPNARYGIVDDIEEF